MLSSGLSPVISTTTSPHYIGDVLSVDPTTSTRKYNSTLHEDLIKGVKKT